jgi:hypothetical protein
VNYNYLAIFLLYGFRIVFADGDIVEQGLKRGSENVHGTHGRYAVLD